MLQTVDYSFPAELADTCFTHLNENVADVEGVGNSDGVVEGGLGAGEMRPD